MESDTIKKHLEKNIKETLIRKFPNAIIPEDLIKNYSNIETVIASTKYLTCALSNDSGISHMLSSGYCPLIKLFGKKNIRFMYSAGKNKWHLSY